MNRFFRPDGEEVYPKRVYARLDSAEPQVDGSSLLAFDAIDAYAIDDVSDLRLIRAVNPNSPIATASICAVTIASTDLATPSTPPDDSEFDQGSWHQLDLDYENGGPALVYASLGAIGRPAYVRRFQPVPDQKAADLSAAFSLDDYIASSMDIEAALSRVRTITHITVYDVGQGSASGLNSAIGAPELYFDFGGGVLVHKPTFPTALTGFCFSQNPTVVLSHWDWDHWSSADLFQASTQLTWIAPNQKLGAIHATFGALIVANGKLLIWPTHLAAAQNHTGSVRIVRCTGAGRNHSGLAAEVHGPNGELPILLTGDARYSAIPGAQANRYSSIVVPHHGADMKLAAVPSCPTHPNGRLVYSCGQPNNFGHPRAITKQNHAAAGWVHNSVRSAGVARFTYHRWPHGLGHVAIGWKSGLLGNGMPCGATANASSSGTCALAPYQD